MDYVQAPRASLPLGFRARSGGFTLLELMVVVMVIAILGAIAYSSFANNVTKSRRTAATACLQERAQFLERYYTTRLTYVGANPTLGCQADLVVHYSFPALTAATATATGYALTAVPVGQQLAKDTLCGTLGINQTGARTESGSATNIADCW